MGVRAGEGEAWNAWINKSQEPRHYPAKCKNLVCANMSVTVHLNASVRACMSACMRVCSRGWEARRRAGGQQTTRPAAPLILQSVCGPTRPGRVQESAWARRPQLLVARHRCRREQATTTQLKCDDVTFPVQTNRVSFKKSVIVKLKDRFVPGRGLEQCSARHLWR